MIYLEIPYVAENDRVSRISAESEIKILNISDITKAEIFEAIYHRRPEGVSFEDKDFDQVLLLENALNRFGIPYRQIKE
jgi:hypothetical protein